MKTLFYCHKPGTLSLSKLAVAIVLLCGGGVSSGQTVIAVKDDVLRPAAAMEPMGVNFFGNIGGVGHANGNLVSDSGFEPARMRILHRVIEAGEDNGRRWITLDGAGTSNYLQFNSGLFSGATMRAYRFVDGDAQPLPYREYSFRRSSGNVLDLSNGKACVPLFTTRVFPKGTDGLPKGGWLAETPDDFADWNAMTDEERAEVEKAWRVYYEGEYSLRMDDVVIFERGGIYELDPQDFHPRLKVKPDNDSFTRVSGSARRIPAPLDVPAAMDAGGGVLEMTPENGRALIWQARFAGSQSEANNWYGVLEPGVRYRYEVWMKEIYGEGGSVLLGFGGLPGKVIDGYFGDKETVKTFPASDKWQRVGFEFVAPEIPDSSDIEGLGLLYQGQGTLLIDNLKLQPVYQVGDAYKPFVVNRHLLETMVANQPLTGRKGAQRGRFGLNYMSMESLCDWVPETMVKANGRIAPFAKQITPGLPQTLTILEATGDSPETRMVPWLVTQVTGSEEEYRQLVEYLCAPYDPKVDSPKGKPMAYKRYRQRGHGRPWSKDFREIIIQPGNENWHNRKLPMWIGMGRAGWVHQGGAEFGLWGKYMFGEMKKSPYYDDNVLKTFLDGNNTAHLKDGKPSGYGFDATLAAEGTNAYMGPAHYIGPRWEYNEKGHSTIDDAGVQKVLLDYRVHKHEEIEGQHEAAVAMRAMGITTKLAAYEGGPSGFIFDKNKKDLAEVAEYYGKTKAMAVAMLDAWLDAWRLGFTYQCYHSFRQGTMWSSHTSYQRGFHPSTGWLAQTMINHQMANGDMLDVVVKLSPTTQIEIPPSARQAKKGVLPTQKQVELIHAYAIRKPNQIAVSVVNLDLKKSHSVEIILPIRSAKAITLHFLTGDPRDTNLENMKIEIATKTIDPTSLTEGRLQADLPPGSFEIYVFEPLAGQPSE